MIGKGNFIELNHCDKISILTNTYYAFAFVRLEAEFQVIKKRSGKDCQIPSLVSKSKIEKVRPKYPTKENNPNDLNFTLENRFQLPEAESTSINKPVLKNDKIAKNKINEKTAEKKPRERKKRSQSLKRRVDKSTSPVQAKRVTRSSSVKTPKSRKSLNSESSKGKGKKNKK